MAAAASRAQTPAYNWGKFSRADTLRGSLSPLRSCYDVHFYDLNLRIDVENRTIAGSNAIHFRVVEPFINFQIDLFEELSVEKIVHRGKTVKFEREGRAIFVQLEKTLAPSSLDSVRVFYRGKPRQAPKPPWDGGFVWSRDENGKPWVGVACQGLGASSWWPLKDHLSDEPDSLRAAFETPEGLTCVSNGRKIQEKPLGDGFVRTVWKISSPINSYNVTINIADYAHFSDTLHGRNGPLTLDYYVLAYNLDKAQKHFRQVKPMLKCFEKYFGPYPFYNDGYKLVETPYWGMEHQSCVAYGNGYKNDAVYDFDFIIVHETGHEWFGNSVSADDHGEMWIHEALTTYAEAVYVECRYDYSAAVNYLRRHKERIQYLEPIQGPRNVNFNRFSTSDMYMKGAWMFHTLRGVVADDSKWFRTLKKFCADFYRKTVDSRTVVEWFGRELTGKSDGLVSFFDAYLNDTSPPVLECAWQTGADGPALSYRWARPSLNMPVDVYLREGVRMRLFPSDAPQTLRDPRLSKQSFRVDEDSFLVKVEFKSKL
ncbi:MAG: M1 family metallopeptidase [Bacteroidia bacterium]|nr:M1 family metallopeptidase [Bacteroidia bacterium]